MPSEFTAFNPPCVPPSGRNWLKNDVMPLATWKPSRTDTRIGAGFWVTPAAGRGKPQVAFAQSGPRDIFLAQGHEGQVVVVVPSKDLVLVRLGLFDDFVGWGPLGAWAVDIINLFPDIERN